LAWLQAGYPDVLVIDLPYLSGEIMAPAIAE
jgi:hypothetical protein